MAKIMLVLDDYEERAFLGISLKKVGFDVLEVAKESHLPDRLLAFKAEIIMIGGEGKNISAVSVGQKLKTALPNTAKVVLLLSKGQKLLPQQMDQMKIDSIIETPCDVEKFFKVLGKFVGLDSQLLIDKFHKAQLSQAGASSQTFYFKGDKKEQDGIHGKLELNLAADEERVSKYQKFLENLPETKETSYPRGAGRSMLKNEHQDLTPQERENLDQKKQAFVKALFTQKK